MYIPGCLYNKMLLFLVCDSNCASGCTLKLVGKCDSQCNSGFVLVTTASDYTCHG